MKSKFSKLYMDIADTVSKTSYAQRSKVGAIAVKDHRILSIGYNGTLPGDSNECEYKEGDVLVTKDSVIHAEANCLMKMTRDGQASLGADMFLTLSPCVSCAKLMILAGIRKIWYRDAYRDPSGIEFLMNHGILVEKIDND